jgi:hypothetical protein
LVENNLDKEWDWNSLSKNIRISSTFIQKYHEKPWNWFLLSQRSEIVLVLAPLLPEKEWKWNCNHVKYEFCCLSHCKFISKDFFEKMCDQDWDWYHMHEHSFVTSELINKYKYKPWNWEALSSYPTITTELIENNTDKLWNWMIISKKYFDSYPNEYYKLKVLTDKYHLSENDYEMFDKYINKIMKYLDDQDVDWRNHVVHGHLSNVKELFYNALNIQEKENKKYIEKDVIEGLTLLAEFNSVR